MAKKPLDNQKLLKTVDRLRSAIAAMARGIIKECRNTKALIERAEGLSTPSQDQKVSRDREPAEVSAAGRWRLAKNRK